MVAPVIAALIPVVPKLLESMFDWVDHNIPDPKAASKAKVELQDKVFNIVAKSDDAQSQINLADANSGSLFRGGWRPFAGWTCAYAVFYQYIIVPHLLWVLTLLHYKLEVPPPTLDGNLWELFMGLLGMAGLREVGKIKGSGK